MLVMGNAYCDENLLLVMRLSIPIVLVQHEPSITCQLGMFCSILSSLAVQISQYLSTHPSYTIEPVDEKHRAFR